MKPKLMLVLGFVVSLFACNDEVRTLTVWGIEYSNLSAISAAAGTIDQQIAGPQITHVVSEAYVTSVGSNDYEVMFGFTSENSLRLIIARHTNDDAFAFPGEVGENHLLYAIFNEDTLTLDASSVIIQPSPGENKLTATIDLHTQEAGNFNGTVSSIPLVKDL
jgi:hypothetical protein